MDASRWVALAEDLRARARSPGIRRALLFAAMALFGGGLYWSLRSLPDSVHLVTPWPLLLVAVFGVTARLALSVAELKASASLVGARLAWADATRVSLLASAANVLPLPGGPMVRIAALKLGGASLARSSGVTLFTALAWLGLALCYAGAWVLPEQRSAALVFLTLGVAATLAAVVLMGSVGQRWGIVVAILWIKAAAIAVGLLRLHWVFTALGLALEPGQLAVFAVSGVAGSIIAIVPAGIGITEAAAALLAPLVGVDSATAFLATSINRLIGLPVLLLLAFGVSLTIARPTGDEP